MLRNTSRMGSVLMAAVAAVCQALPAAAQDHKDPRAVEIAHTMMQAMGGEDSWSKAHFVRFDFVVRAGGKTVVDRYHLWDKYTGRYRLESKTKDGKPQVVLFNTATKQGTVYIDGKTLEGAAAKKELDDAYGAWINDMYWMAEPWKWLEAGVNLKYMGEKKLGQGTFDEVEITFGRVGLTPGDRYDTFVSRDSHLMTHWDYVLQSHNKGSWDWQYADTHGMKLAGNHVSADKKTNISMGDVRVLDAVDGAFFTDPAHQLSELK